MKTIFRLQPLLVASRLGLLLIGTSFHGNAQSIGFTEGFEIANWDKTEILASGQTVSDGVTTMAELDGGAPAQSAEFTYNVSLAGGGVSNRTADFTITVANNSEITFDWELTGMHAWWQAMAEFRIIVNGVVLESPVDLASTSGDFFFSGIDQKVSLQAGDTFGFRIGGQNFDSTSIIRGALTVSNFRVVQEGESDSDQDGLPDIWEIKYGLSTEDDGSIDINNGPDGDPDDDGLTNSQELEAETDPTLADTDSDGLLDGVEDGGGVFISLEETGTNPIVADTDGDGLLDGVENPLLPFVDASQTGTDPHNEDTDRDGTGDGIEVSIGRNPTLAEQLEARDGIVANFDGLGEIYSEEARRGAPMGRLIAGDAQSDGNYYQLLETTGNLGNFISFESKADFTGWENFAFTMDFLATSVAADGFGINFLSTENHGDSGVIPNVGNEEDAAVDNSFGVGFKTFQATEASVTWNGADYSGRLPFTLTTDTWASLSIDVDRDPETNTALVDVSVYSEPNRQGLAENIFTDFKIENMDLQDFRVQVMGRTGGSSMNLGIDNLVLLVDGATSDAPLEIIDIQTQIEAGGQTRSITITWNSKEGRNYRILANNELSTGDLAGWDELDDSVAAEAGKPTTSFTELGIPLTSKKRFYVVEMP
jgi:hypothetical protein